MSTPRVNSRLISDYPQKTVLLVGNLLGIQGNQAILEASDKGQVSVQLAPVALFNIDEKNSLFNDGNEIYEVIAKVKGPNYVQELTSSPWQGSLGTFLDIHPEDMEAYEKMIQNAQKYKTLFNW